MRDQAALRVDDVGMAALADLDLRDHVPDQLEIDLGDAHAGVAPRAGDGERHVGLGFAAEIDRPVIDLARRRFRELGIIGEVGGAADHVHGEPRHPQPLLAGGVDLRELGDGWNLAKEPQPVEAALLDRARRPRQLRGPAELALDLLDELADLGGGSLGLLALDADLRRLILSIIEQDIENAVGHERDADHRHEQRDIFGEQPPAGLGDRRLGRGLSRRVSARSARWFRGTPKPKQRKSPHKWPRYQVWSNLSPGRDVAYSMTSSARASSIGGTSSPSARAVLRLITSSNLVGACTGRSPGLAPLKIRS